MLRCLTVLTAAVTSALGGDLELLGDASKIVFLGDEGAEKASLSASIVSSILARLSALESADAVTNSTLLSFSGKLATLQTSIDAHTVKLLAVDATNTEDASKIAAITAVNAAEDAKIAAVESVNAAQDSKITAVENVNTIQETKITTATSTNTAQDSKISAVEAVNTQQETKITTATSTNTAQDSRLSSIETVNSAQDVKLTNLTGDITVLKSKTSYDASRFKGPSSDGYYWVRVPIENNCYPDYVMSACTRRNMDSPCGYPSQNSINTNSAGRACIFTVLGGQSHLSSDGCGAYMTNCNAAIGAWHGPLFDNTITFSSSWNGWSSSFQVGLTFGHQWQSGTGYDTVCVTKNPSTAIL